MPQTLITMNFGTLPTFAEFEEAFDREVPSGEYRITMGRSDADAFEGFRLGTDSYRCSELWAGIVEVAEYVGRDYPEDEDTARDDTMMSFVSGILETLGWEWI